MKKESFKNPGNRYRPMKIMHSFNMDGLTDEKKKEKADEVLNRLKTLGYGGITTNTPFSKYLTPEGFEDFNTAVKEAIYKNMRIWIYDEKGYPSGTAGGLTLQDHPEYEAKGLVMEYKVLGYGEEWEAELPKAHDKTVAAYAFRLTERQTPVNKKLYCKEEDIIFDSITGAPVDLIKRVDDYGTVTWRGGDDFEDAKEDEKYLLCIFRQKRLYEHTHARQNFHEARRYLSVINKKAVGEFINNTYEAYKKEAGDYFGREIEAFFTDEPSLMAGYLDGTVSPGADRIKDPACEDMPLLPVVTWEPFLADEFMNRYGYDLMSSLHWLFAGTTEAGVKVRYDFNLMISELYKDAYYGQIRSFCENEGIQFSGHVLMEEYLLHHGIWEGNIFRIMEKMDVPGIDVLTSMPGEIVDMAVTPKLISSAGRWFGKDHIMSESSGFEQNRRKIPFGSLEMKGSIAAQFVMGVNNIQSYYGDVLPENEFRQLMDCIARMGEAMDGGKDGADIILFYPIDGILSQVKGSDKFRESREYSEAELECADSWNDIAKMLLRNRLDYIMADKKAIENLVITETEEGVFAENLMTGNLYKTIVIPKIIATDRDFLNKLSDFADAGITVIFDSLSVNTANTKGDGALKDEIADLLSMENVINVSKTEDIPEVLRSVFVPQLELEGEENGDIIYTRRSDTSCGLSEVYLIVNTGRTKGMRTFIINPGKNKVEKVLCLEPETGSVTPLKYSFTEDGRIKVKCRLDVFDVTMIGIE